jgi:hypothetical protein
MSSMFVIFKQTAQREQSPKVYNRSIGENSPNLVTLIAIKASEGSGPHHDCSKLSQLRPADPAIF